MISFIAAHPQYFYWPAKQMADYSTRSTRNTQNIYILVTHNGYFGPVILVCKR